MAYIGTTTPLLANATYTSNWVLTNTADQLTGSIFSDKAGTIYIEQSSDGTNADISTSYSTIANDGAGIQEDILCPWARIKFTNGGVDQTAFRLNIHFSSAGVKP